LVKKLKVKSEADKTAKRTKAEVSQAPKVESKTRYIPGSLKGTTEKKVISKTSYKTPYIPGSWKETTEKKSNPDTFRAFGE